MTSCEKKKSRSAKKNEMREIIMVERASKFTARNEKKSVKLCQ